MILQIYTLNTRNEQLRPFMQHQYDTVEVKP